MTRPTSIELTATLAAANVASRTLSGTVVPYGVAGDTSLGPVIVTAGAVELPTQLDRIKLNRDHDRTAPIGYAEHADDTDAGLDMRFRVARTPDGDAALVDAAEKVRDAFSVELDHLEFASDDAADGDEFWTITAARLVGVAQCSTPAYADARITDVAAAHAGDHSGGDMPRTTPAAADAAAKPDAKPDEQQATTPPAPVVAAAPDQLRPGSGRPAAPASQASAVDRLASLLCALRQGSPTPELLAELSDITYTAGDVARAPDYAGELWDGLQYVRRIYPLLAHRPLTSMKGTGWLWTTPPEVGDYAGDKAAIPSNVPAIDDQTWTAKRLAGGHDIDRAYFDFGDTDFIAAYWREMTESWAVQSDQRYYTMLDTWAQAATGDGGGDLVTAVSEGMGEVEDNLNGASPTFVLTNPAETRAYFIGQTEMEKSAWLDELGIKPEQWVRWSGVPAGTVIVGHRQGGVFLEPGVPIRVQAVDVANGGIDAGLFGYYAGYPTKAGAIVKVNVAAAGV